MKAAIGGAFKPESLGTVGARGRWLDFVRHVHVAKNFLLMGATNGEAICGGGLMYMRSDRTEAGRDQS
jgi:hypothetical protein